MMVEWIKSIVTTPLHIFIGCQKVVVCAVFGYRSADDRVGMTRKPVCAAYITQKKIMKILDNSRFANHLVLRMEPYRVSLENLRAAGLSRGHPRYGEPNNGRLQTKNTFSFS